MSSFFNACCAWKFKKKKTVGDGKKLQVAAQSIEPSTQHGVSAQKKRNQVKKLKKWSSR